ncbi:glycoside hydrolase family 2 TIM barrel-domain containing protein [Hymenobacter fodinae]|uniref:DUF4434 domain-containing protein n=1 Tax=Hymenobacter fodinae TaxID=2510796 RepID=A0A4Z0P538_9BACT|nr:glycoside hydrolase family 2 TIM barrel-domain containing protein [Hymenobacter fodinae]TGE06349.1 DUF4434 domain-containing protein [Hymenobacter fodinae]
MGLISSKLLKNLRRWVVASFIGSQVCLLVGACSTKHEKPATTQLPAGVVPVRVVRVGSGYQLQRNGKPYFIKGGAGLEHYDQLKAAGANSVRLWSADYADDRMDEAQRQGLTVTLGVWLVHESKQFDYNNTWEVEQQKKAIREQVLRYRYHPALLAWSVGNEVNYESNNPLLYRAINDIARMVHELDPYHPVTSTVTSTLENFDRIKRLCPDLDFISVNSFGNLYSVADRLKREGWHGPFLITEFGARGYWESPKTGWGTAKEQTSTQKAQFARERYEKAIAGNPTTCLGGYVFYWGNKFEYTSTWFSLFTPTGEKTATVDVMQELWTGKPPRNLSPQIQELQVAGQSTLYDRQLLPDKDYSLKLIATDPENDSLQAQWQLTPDAILTDASDIVKSTPTVPIEHAIRALSMLEAVLHTPRKPGPYRLSATVLDGKGSAATIGIPFLVVSGEK